MALPSKLKNFILFNDGNSYVGKVAEITLPKLSRKMEEYRAGGMSGPVETDHGSEKIELQWTAGGLLVDALKQWATTKHDAVQLRFAGAYQAEDTGNVQAVEVVVRGRHKEIDFGNSKLADDTAHKFSTTCSYYKLTVDNEVIIELDLVNAVELVGGVDRLSGIRRAIGL